MKGREKVALNQRVAAQRALASKKEKGPGVSAGALVISA
jgi:hypothetical protein